VAAPHVMVMSTKFLVAKASWRERDKCVACDEAWTNMYFLFLSSTGLGVEEDAMFDHKRIAKE
jgi:hypothetical protein